LNDGVDRIDLFGLVGAASIPGNVPFKNPWTNPPPPPTPPPHRPPQNTDCCDSETIEKGRQILLDRFNKAYEFLTANNVPSYSDPHGPHSCIELSRTIAKFVTPSPKCWTCVVENRRESWKPWSFIPFQTKWIPGDENFIVCTSHPASRYERAKVIVFDYWVDIKASDNYEYFHDRWPVLKEIVQQFPNVECGPETSPPYESENYEWLKGLIVEE
jgi:hypothetical protein